MALPVLGLGALGLGVLGAGGEAIKGIATGAGMAASGLFRGIGDSADGPPGLEVPFELGRGKSRKVHVAKVNAAQLGLGAVGIVTAYGLWCLIQHGPRVLWDGCRVIDAEHGEHRAPLALPIIPTPPPFPTPLPWVVPAPAPAPSNEPSPGPGPAPAPAPTTPGVPWTPPTSFPGPGPVRAPMIGEWRLPGGSDTGAGDRLPTPDVAPMPAPAWTPGAPAPAPVSTPGAPAPGFPDLGPRQNLPGHLPWVPDLGLPPLPGAWPSGGLPQLLPSWLPRLLPIGGAAAASPTDTAHTTHAAPDPPLPTNERGEVLPGWGVAPIALSQPPRLDFHASQLEHVRNAAPPAPVFAGPAPPAWTAMIGPGFKWFDAAQENRAFFDDSQFRLALRDSNGRAATFILTARGEAVRLGGDEAFLQGVARIPAHKFWRLHNLAGGAELTPDQFHAVVRGP